MITSLKNRIIQIRIIIFVFTAVILTAIIHIVSYPPLLTPGITVKSKIVCKLPRLLNSSQPDTQ